MATLDELYACYEELNSAANKSEKKDAYLTVLNGAKGAVNEKRLASQLIARFFKHFPDVHEQALNALLDLCEDADVAIRKQAIRDLPTICRECPTYTQRIADILTQLLQVEDPVELRLVEHALMELARRDARETFAGILNQLDSSTDDSTRSHAARFIGARVKELGESGMLANVSDCETYLADRINEVMRKRKASLGGDEFVSLMTALSALKTMQTVTGRAHLVALACEQVVATVPAGSECDSEQLDKLLTCCKLTTPLLSKNVNANPIIEYVCTRVLPHLEATHTVTLDADADAQAESTAAPKSSDLHLDVLKEFAEVCASAGRFEPARADELVSHIITALNGYLQAPAPDDAAPDATRTVTDAVDDLQLSHIECLLFAFHQLGRFVVAYSNAEGVTKEDAERERDTKTVEALRELQKRLHLAARRVQQLRTKLNEALRSRPASRTETPDDKLKDAALRTLNNIFLLIRDLLHYPPLFKATVTLSWKPPPPPAAPVPPTQPAAARQTSTSSNGARQPAKTNAAPAKPNGAQKRPAEPPTRGAHAAVPTVAKQARRARPTQAAIYQPPSARFGYNAGAGASASARPGTRPGVFGPRAASYHPGSRPNIGRGGNRRGAFRGGRY